MTTPASAPRPETAFQRERRLLGELSARLLDALLNRMFDLRPERAARRRSYLVVLFLLSGVGISLYYYPPVEWFSRIGNLINILLSQTSTPAQLQAALEEFRTFFYKVLVDPRILQYLPVFLAPFFIALHSAAIYLADIFELEDVSIARQFIWNVALGGSSATIRIQEGEIAEESRESPVVKIGGPGHVVVALDSAALFERADGTPHVIGPTGALPGGKATLEGFERFRQAFDLRDQNEQSRTVKSRSLDGIRVRAVDVRFRFSVYRGENPQRTNDMPYPFVEKAIENLVYKAASRVSRLAGKSSVLDSLWYAAMAALIRRRLGSFMSDHKLTDYLANIGTPEVERAREREATILREIQALTHTDDELEPKQIKPPPPFYTRPQIRDLFDRFAAEFTEEAKQSGVELHWIGIGTWETPEQTHPKNHKEAWKLTQDNQKNGSEDSLKKADKEATVAKMKELISKVPLEAYEEITGASSGKKAKPEAPSEGKDSQHLLVEGMKDVLEGIHENMKEEKKEETAGTPPPSHSHNIKTLLLTYRNQIQETIDFIRAKNEPVPEHMIRAVKLIDNLLAHWVS